MLVKVKKLVSLVNSSNKGNDSWAVREELLSINWKLLELNWKHVKQPVKAKKLPVGTHETLK